MMKLNLHKIAEHLESLEETIIFKLIERGQWKSNDIIYKQGQSGFKNNMTHSLLELRMLYQERMDAEFGRFFVPEERPFNEGLPSAKRKVNLPENGLHIYDYNAINLTEKIMSEYLLLIPKICITGDDSQYGSSVEHDVSALQAISRRIHYGSFYVAECKYLNDTLTYRALIKENDYDGLYFNLTRKDVEEKIISRVKEKVAVAQAKARNEIRHIINPEIVIQFYRDCIIPTTKKGEVLYLLQRPEN